MTADPLADRRLRVVRLPYHDVLDWFAFAIAGRPARVAVPHLAAGLPRDVRVIAAREDFACRTIDFMVSHPSFDPVPEGHEVPRHGGPLEWTTQMMVPGPVPFAGVGWMFDEVDIGEESGRFVRRMLDAAGDADAPTVVGD